MLMEYTCRCGKISSKNEITYREEEREIEAGVTEYRFFFSWDAEKAQGDSDVLRISMLHPAFSCRNRWNPLSGPSRKLDAVWRSTVRETKLSTGAPVVCIFNTDDRNTYTVAVSEILKSVKVNAGPDEGGGVECVISIPMAQFYEANGYVFRIRIDTRSIPYYEVLDDVRAWWEEVNEIAPMPVPEQARLPMYSSWYAYHYAISDSVIEEACRQAKALGLEGIIVDDGWQIEQAAQGYAYCGDWEIIRSKFPDMKAHVARVHEMGMKYMMWFSVPYVGIYSKNYGRFKGKYLGGIRSNAQVLDPRYQDVRVFLADIYERFAREYELDGLKLDFIDEFAIPTGDTVKPEMDYTCVQEAVSALLTEVKDRLIAFKPDFMIEFRQNYTGPGMRRFGNIFRVGDCPCDGYSNHIGIADIRLLAGGSAVHSDMVIWNSEEPVEDSALQLLDCLFGVLQYSVRIEEQDEAHLRMSAFWIGFMKEHRKLLLESKFIPEEPQNMYPLITVQHDTEALSCVYARDRVVTIPEGVRHFYVANATRCDYVLLRSHVKRNMRITVRNCMGERLSQRNLHAEQGINCIDVPVAGILECKIESE